jgi:glycosyltransferase involved in cell wall biosynthesis
MNVLMLTPYLPYPLLSGGQIRTYNLLKNLSEKHNITLFALIKDESEREHINELKKYCKKVMVFKRSEKPFTLSNIIKTGFSAFPFLVIRNHVSEVSDAVRKELQSDTYDLIHAETFYMMPNIPPTRTPVLLVEQTIEYLGYLSYARSTKFWPIKPLLYIDIFKIRLWEENFWKTCDRLVVMSEDDRSFLQQNTKGIQRIDVVENGVDVGYFQETKKNLPEQPTVLFVGTFKWLPNVEAVRYLVKKIWPLIRASIPNARLRIVGSSPTKEIYSFAEKNEDITVEGSVQDIREAYARSHVLLAPIFSGKGTRYKVLEAFATGTPVVATRLAVEGLNIRKGVHALIGNTERELADHTVTVLNDRVLQKQLAKSGMQLAFNEYNWERIATKLDTIYRELGQRREREGKI